MSKLQGQETRTETLAERQKGEMMPDYNERWMDKMGRVNPGKPEDWNTDEEPQGVAAVSQKAMKGHDDVLKRIMDRVNHARTKHPDWLKRDDYVLSVAEMEWYEFCHALNWEGRTRAGEEALDLIAVLVRYLEGDAE